MSIKNQKKLLALSILILAAAQSSLAQYNPDNVVFDRGDESKIFFTPELNPNSKLWVYEYYDHARNNAAWTATRVRNYPHSQYKKGSQYDGKDWDFKSDAVATTKAGGNEWFTYRSQISRSDVGISCPKNFAPASCQVKSVTIDKTTCTSQTISFGLDGGGEYPIKVEAGNATLGVTPSIGYSKGWSVCQTRRESDTCRGIPGQEVYFTNESINTMGDAETTRELEIVGGYDTDRQRKLKPFCESIGGRWTYNEPYGNFWGSFRNYYCEGAKAKWDKYDFWPRRNAPVVSSCRSRPSTG